MMLKKWLVFFLTTLFMLSACRSPVYDQTEANVANVKLRAQASRQKSDRDARALPSLLVKKGLYVDTSPISLERSPAWLNNRIVIRGDQLPFSYYSRTIASGATNNVLTKYQVGLNPAINVSINYAGTVRGALDMIAAKTGYVYNVHGNNIYWQSLVTRTFDIAFMPGGTDYLLGKTSNSSSTASTSSGGGMTGTVSNFVSSDASDSEYSNLKGTLSIWKDLDTTIRQLLSPEGRVTVSESTTSVTVRDKPSNVALIGQYIENLNRSLSKQVLVKIQVLEVNLENDWDFGIDWQLIMRAFHNSPFIVNGSYGTPVKISQVFTPQATLNGQTPVFPQFGTQVDQTKINQIPSWTILFNALSQQGKTSVVSEPRVVCLNNQVSVVRIVQQNGYVASIQNTSLAGTGSSTGGSTNVGTVTSQVTPGTVITGLTLYILPKIMHENIYMQVNADLSTNDGFQTFGAPNSQIQLPNITEKHFNQRSMIRSGDTLILSGFRQLTNQAKANQFITSQALGGKGSQALNRETIVLIQPIIMPTIPNGTA